MKLLLRLIAAAAGLAAAVGFAIIGNEYRWWPGYVLAVAFAAIGWSFAGWTSRRK